MLAKQDKINFIINRYLYEKNADVNKSDGEKHVILKSHEVTSP